MSVEVLPSARSRSARLNLDEFVRQARDDISAFGRDLDFDATVWDVTASLRVRASSGHQSAKLYFTEHPEGTGKGMDGRVPFAEAFAPFVKAIVRRRQDAASISPQLHGVTIRAARYLHEVLGNREYDPTRLVPDDFAAAARACAKREKPSSAYRACLQLAVIADFVNRYNLARVRIDFRNPVARGGNDETRIGEEADKRRASKLPSSAALDALAQISNLDLEPGDLLRMRILELLVCGGWRINELLTIGVGCEVEETATVNGRPLLDAGGLPTVRYGISYWPEKGAAHRVKWIPTAMVDVAKRAIRDVRRLTREARATLEWMVAHPGRALLPEPWRDEADDRLFGMREILDMFGLKGRAGNAKTFLEALRVPLSGPKGKHLVRRSDLEAGLLAAHALPGARDGHLRLRGHLFVMPRNWTHRDRATVSGIVEAVTDQQVSNFCAGREGVPTIFERHGFVEDDGMPISVTSHQFRHWLNTLQQEGGMSQMEIARWSGRKDTGHNADYDHVTGIQLAEKARAMLEAGRVHGPVAKVHERLPPVRRSEFRNAQFATAHTTDIGMCVNDWSLAPCPSHGSCPGCEQHLVVKGDEAGRARAAQMLAEHETLLASAEAEAEEETYGASNFVDHNRAKCRSLRRILAVHDDPSLPDGDLVHVELRPSHESAGLEGGTSHAFR